MIVVVGYPLVSLNENIGMNIIGSVQGTYQFNPKSHFLLSRKCDFEAASLCFENEGCRDLIGCRHLTDGFWEKFIQVELHRTQHSPHLETSHSLLFSRC